MGAVQGPGEVELTVDEIGHQHIRAVIDDYMRYSPREKEEKGGLLLHGEGTKLSLELHESSR